MSATSTFKMAAIQAAPVLFDKSASTEKACNLIAEAGKRGVDIAAFGECWLPGYPFWVDGPVIDLTWEVSAVFLENAVELDGPEVAALCEAAAGANVDVMIGVAERDPHTQGTAYATALTVGREGVVLNRHRKLKPTHAERIIWGDGDGAGLNVIDRDYGRISALNCWEHQMMLPGYALAAQGTQIHAALWPGWEKEPRPSEYCWARQHLLSRAFASQAGAYVVCAAGVRLEEHIPDKWKPFGVWEHPGKSAIIDPRGEIIAEAGVGEDMLIAEGSLDMVRAAKSACDIAGHYSRPDVFDFRVNMTPAGARVQRVSELTDGVLSGSLDEEE
ncbi:carbon-nitrogen hydrolase family protein [Hyphococcus flavus]|uniref:Carbon-nitrogen hydrolase family protein n=1 Tax=Hyphococcus flavus TaxID=1866326 RepID=A0AAE9ZFL4_9PROT|nr:carbon-nitrogen hydrolase family protein [Hyphococcus flavus]WDI32013.1 carbon-nitrogen hydrolase family protein [Hyphococcus flavus]